MKPVLGIIAGLIVIIGTVPYLRDILRHETKPSRATWTLLTILLFIDIFIQGELGTGWAIALTVGDFLACASVFVLSLKYGSGGAERSDIICYGLWVITVICWLGLNRPLLALHFGVLADFVALVPTFIKSWKKPDEESTNVFIASSLSGLVALFAVETYSYGAILLPLYLFIVNLAVAVVIILAHRRDAAISSSLPSGRSRP